MKKSRILIVDDDVSILDSLRRNLVHDYDVVTKQSGFEAVDAITRDKSFKVILSDYKMPKLNGL
ncbi:response regulator, partial [Myxococcota bacterium]|nr:response regulator [Myxococcota bacterium]